MNAIVEVGAAEAVSKVEEVVVVTTVHNFFAPKALADVAPASTLHIPSIGGCSLSAVAPDTNFEKETLAAAVCSG